MRIGHDGTVDRIKKGDEIILPPIEGRKIGPRLLDHLSDLRTGRIPDPFGWVVKV